MEIFVVIEMCDYEGIAAFRVYSTLDEARKDYERIDFKTSGTGYGSDECHLEKRTLDTNHEEYIEHKCRN